MTLPDAYHTLYEQVPTAIVTVDADGRITDCNRAACLLIGSARDELLLRPVLAIVDPVVRVPTRAAFRRALLGESTEVSAVLRHAVGTPVSVRIRIVRAAPDPEDGRQTVHAFLTEAEPGRMRRATTDHLLELLGQLPGQITAVLDASGRIRDVSGLSSTHWFDEGVWVGRPFADLSLEDAEERHRVGEMLRATGEGREWSGVLCQRRADGSRVEVELFARPARGLGAAGGGTLLAGRELGAVHVPVSKRARRGIRVLVVDDDQGVRAVLRKYLERAGHVVLEAWSGRSALAHITNGARPDVVLTDLRMEDGTGIWLLDQLQRDFPELLQRTAVVTGGADSEQLEALGKRYPCPVLEKPLEVVRVFEVVQRLVGQGGGAEQ